ncbi:hypothetical protein FRACYDRAFT_250039 [Fragilariopsis cylindrus CCMP1102]|uniref:Isochorismatase-like domain-containing protein n=1 Tax=Fragilariopsis cylindrus CCMP1102 TaxID=635003 RepID=A0A1E7EQP6_9STRA|nr:hypothetical protein FRACYDRAFT_250039 [Fragilariopsis cylindrus CCMP1102]|eukprot:OEU08252.1 hypothetical protein FRACYDRAFT_250039 [Fragilariopsis cylindrus CCMP1102]
MSIPIDQQQLQQRQLNDATEKKNRRTNDVVTSTTMLLAAARQRSTSMLSLHWGGFPKRISPEDFNLSWNIPSEVKIYPTINYRRRRINTTSNNTKATPTTTTPSTPSPTTNDFNNNSSSNNNRNKTILVVVGVPDTYKENELSSTTTRSSNPKCFSGSLYSHTQFLYFQQNLMKSIQLCRARKNTGIIHISNSSSSGSGLPKTAVTKRHSLRPQHQKENEIFISKPIWSTSGNILLLDALEKLSSSSSSPQQQQQQQQQRGNSIIVNDKTTKTTKNNTTTVLVCGLVTSVCVLHSAMVCSEAGGYKTYIIEDSCADRDRIRHDHAISLAEEDTQKLEVISTIIPSLSSSFKHSRYSI